MGREIRKVPWGWEHPKMSNGNYQPMYDETYKQAAEDWIKGFLEWENKPEEEKDGYEYYWDSEGYPPNEESYRPEFENEPNCFQIYETVSEGTPVSPVFKTKEELIAWLIEQGYSEKTARKFSEDEWVMSGMFYNGKMYSGIEACGID